MRAYFIILFGLSLMAVFVSYKIVATLPFNRSDDQMSRRAMLVSNDNGTSGCFEKRYSPQIRECGGLLKYSAPSPSYHDDALQRSKPKRRHLSGRLPIRDASNKSRAALGKSGHPSVPRHFDMANFQ